MIDCRTQWQTFWHQFWPLWLELPGFTWLLGGGGRAVVLFPVHGLMSLEVVSSHWAANNVLAFRKNSMVTPKARALLRDTGDAGDAARDIPVWGWNSPHQPAGQQRGTDPQKWGCPHPWWGLCKPTSGSHFVWHSLPILKIQKVHRDSTCIMVPFIQLNNFSELSFLAIWNIHEHSVPSHTNSSGVRITLQQEHQK